MLVTILDQLLIPAYKRKILELEKRSHSHEPRTSRLQVFVIFIVSKPWYIYNHQFGIDLNRQDFFL